MPFNDKFIDGMKKSKIADLFNTNYSGYGGSSSSAAGFLKEFTENIPYIHFDIAGTASVNGVSTGVLVKTLAELANKI
jgi:leucyl aminopeptidase